MNEGSIMPVQKGDRIRIEYEGFLDDGRVFDSTEIHGFPMKVTVGEGVFLDAFEEALPGMEVDEMKIIRLSPSEAYGEYRFDRIKLIPREHLPTKSELEIGNLLILDDSDGNETPTKIIDFTEEEVTLDFNHPLAGITLNFKVKILEKVR
jgi:FKBP-type peptidyl-prolyl cis-trans isomerase 2